MDYERALISKVLVERNMDELMELSVRKELFIQYSALWGYILAIYSEHRSVPPIEDIEKKYPDFEIGTINASVSFLVEELRKRHVHNILAESLKSQAKYLKNKDPYAALEAARKTLIQADQDTRPSMDVNIVEDPLSRKQQYDDLVDMGGILGLPSPWPCLDEETRGFQGGQLIMIAGRGSVGKTWAETVLAWYHWTQGYIPLLFGREMSIWEHIRRTDSVHAKLPYKRFRAGQLTQDEYDKWVKCLEDMKGGLPFWISGDDEGSLGVSGIAAKIRKYGPHGAYIDGAYLVADDRGATQSWEKFSNVCWDLKRLARKEDIPIIVTHQFNLAGKGLEGNADTLKYGDVQMWFDLVIGMYQTEDLRLNKEMLFKINKQREGDVLEWVSEWDLERMSFEVKSMGEDDVGEEIPEDEDEPLRF